MVTPLRNIMRYHYCCLILVALSCWTDALTPIQFASLAGQSLLKYPNYFLQWGYGDALIIDGLQQANATFGLPFNEQLDWYLDGFQKNPDAVAYKVLHNITMPFDTRVGDYTGLFPITYLNRALMYTGRKPGYDNTSDMYIATTVAEKYVKAFPLRLPDGTFSRHTGWPGEKDRNASFVWADDQYMGLTLLSRLAVVLRRRDYALFVAKQALTFARHLMDSDGISFHGYNDASGHHSCCKWGRANGWGIISHVEVLEALSSFQDLKSSQPFTDVQTLLRTHARGVLRHQAADGRFHQVVDHEETFLETSSTAMYASAIARGVTNGWLDKNEFDAALMKAWAGLQKTITKQGQITGACEGTGIETSVEEYQQRSTSYWSSTPGVGAVLYAAVDIHDYLACYGRPCPSRLRH